MEREVELEEKRREAERLLAQAFDRYGVARVHEIVCNALYALNYLSGCGTKDRVH